MQLGMVTKKKVLQIWSLFLVEGGGSSQSHLNTFFSTNCQYLFNQKDYRSFIQIKAAKFGRESRLIQTMTKLLGFFVEIFSYIIRLSSYVICSTCVMVTVYRRDTVVLSDSQV